MRCGFKLPRIPTMQRGIFWDLMERGVRTTHLRTGTYTGAITATAIFGINHSFKPQARPSPPIFPMSRQLLRPCAFLLGKWRSVASRQRGIRLPFQKRGISHGARPLLSISRGRRALLSWLHEVLEPTTKEEGGGIRFLDYRNDYRCFYSGTHYHFSWNFP